MIDLLKFLENQLREKVEEELRQSEENPRSMLILKCKRCRNTNTLLIGFHPNDKLDRACSWCNQLLLDYDGKRTQWCYLPAINSHTPLPALNCSEAHQQQSKKLGRSSG